MAAGIYFILLFKLAQALASEETLAGMSTRTALNEPYRGLVEAMPIPAELHQRGGRTYASFGSTVPIHCCSPDQVEALAATTHHYCDVFSEQLLAPLGELAYVRLDESTAEKVFINRSKRLLLVSSDGRLAQWRSAPSFESHNALVAGAPLVNKDGELVSVVTARRGNHYAVSAFEGEGGYFDTTEPWKVVEAPEGALLYGDRSFASREELREYVGSLGPAGEGPLTPVLRVGGAGPPRIALVAPGGRQLAHHYLHAVSADRIDYL